MPATKRTIVRKKTTHPPLRTVTTSSPSLKMSQTSTWSRAWASAANRKPCAASSTDTSVLDLDGTGSYSILLHTLGRRRNNFLFLLNSIIRKQKGIEVFFFQNCNVMNNSKKNASLKPMKNHNNKPHCTMIMSYYYAELIKTRFQICQMFHAATPQLQNMRAML